MEMRLDVRTREQLFTRRQRLADALARSRPGSAREAADRCFGALTRFRSGTPASDDLTLLVLHRSAEATG